jgi:hypothetical protein
MLTKKMAALNAENESKKKSNQMGISIQQPAAVQVYRE